MKRVFDILFSSLGLLLLIPLFLIIGLLIKLDDKGNIFFTQIRVGNNGKLFKLYKFRTMSIPESVREGEFEPGDRSRVTAAGRLLRKTKLDELPQLINVLSGKMSFVGPRPEVEKWVAVYPERWKRILSIKPGITDNASIVFRNEEYLLSESDDPEKTYKEIILPRKLDLYEEYVINHSFFGDINLIFKTIFSIFQ
jgi:lipopolysaccharide/colanic/teichoic acid biosynthesis glycosyltransferase